VTIRDTGESLQFLISSRYVEYFGRYEGKIKKQSSHTDDLVVPSFLLNYWTYEDEL
jgi:hypothetical protein